MYFCFCGFIKLIIYREGLECQDSFCVGVDYNIGGTTQLLNFQPQQQRMAVPVNITNDSLPEEVEEFFLFLTVPVGAPPYRLGHYSRTVVRILDNDSKQQA